MNRGVPWRARLAHSFQFWQERDQIVADMQAGRYTVEQTVRRLAAHREPGGRERLHNFSCTNGFLACKDAGCRFAFDLQFLVPLTETQPQ